MLLSRKQQKRIEKYFRPCEVLPDPWRRIVSSTWDHYYGSETGDLMYRHYFLGERSEQLKKECGSYYYCRSRFLLYAAREAALAGIDIF